MDIKNVSTWEKKASIQASGTRAKFWLINPDNSDKYLFKIPRKNTGEAWAEKIASEVGRLLQFPVVDISIARYHDINGILSLNFRHNSEEFFEGGDLFTSQITGFDRYRLDYYEYETIVRLLKEYDLEKDFVFLPIFDALIGNQDRHCDNWGILRGDKGFRFSPAYDNGSSLGFQITEDRIKKMILDENMFKAYSSRSYALIGIVGKRKPKHFDLLSVVNQHYPLEVRQVIKQLEILNRSNIEKIVNSIPNELMNVVYKEWVLRLLLYRKKWILEWYRKESR